MQENGNAATVMLGLPGFVLLAVSELGDEVEYATENSEAVSGCPGCGVLARLHDRRRTDVRDLPAAGRAVTLVWIKRSGGAWSGTARCRPGPRPATRFVRGRR